MIEKVKNNIVDAHTAIQTFLRHEASSGMILLAAAITALAVSNSPLSWLYDGLLATPVAVQIGALELAKPLLLWINDGLMAIFFFLVGLEIKREMLEGELSSRDQIILPGLAALGGMAVPAAIYVFFNWPDPVTLHGWAIPTATDIAFALGVLALLGSRVPTSLKVFLLTLAILDDLGAILVIAVFYSSNLSGLSLSLAGLGLLGLITLNRLGVTKLPAYILLGVFMWVCVLKSGVHATLAGVLLALTIPLSPAQAGGRSPLRALEHALHPWVAFGIMPLFAFANAGVSLAGMSLSTLLGPVPFGVAAGLFLGKQIGVFATVWAAIRLGLARLPNGVNWTQVYGVALLTGIGFTMSLFIGTLAFDDPANSAAVRIGVLGGSLLSAVGSYLVLRYGLPTLPRARWKSDRDWPGLVTEPGFVQSGERRRTTVVSEGHRGRRTQQVHRELVDDAPR